MSELIRTDSHGRVTLAGHPDSTYFLHEEPDGVLVLEPTAAMSVAQSHRPPTSRSRLPTVCVSTSSSTTPSTAVKHTYRRR